MDYTVYKMNRLDNDCYPLYIEAFIFFGTNEERSWNVLKKFSLDRGRLPKQILTLKTDNVEMSIKNKGKYLKNAELISTKFNRDLSCNIISCLRDINEYIKGKKRICIDISVMPIPIFTQILHFLIKKHDDKEIIVYYTEPGHYNLDNLFDFNSLNGEIEIKAIPGFEGKTAQGSEIQRVIFYILGFEMNYLNKLIPQETNPDRIVPINGFPSYFPKYKDISIINNNVNYHEMDIHMFFASANNPFETYNQLNCLKNQYENYCIDIIPAGTKPMALGACLFALKSGSNDVRLLFPFPSEYKNQNSIGEGKIWEYVIN